MGMFFTLTILIQECFVTRLMTVFSLYHNYLGKRSTFSFEQTNIFLNHLRMLYTYFGYKWPNGWDILKSCQIISFISYHINYFSLEKAVTFDLNNIYTFTRLDTMMLCDKLGWNTWGAMGSLDPTETLNMSIEQFEHIRYYRSFTTCIETHFRLLEQVTII